MQIKRLLFGAMAVVSMAFVTGIAAVSAEPPGEGIFGIEIAHTNELAAPAMEMAQAPAVEAVAAVIIAASLAIAFTGLLSTGHNSPISRLSRHIERTIGRYRLHYDPGRTAA